MTMTSTSTTAIVATITFFILSCPFYLLIGVGSFHYYVARLNASEKAIEAFLGNLRFPFTIYSQGEGVAQSIKSTASIRGGIGTCILASMFPLILASGVLVASFPQHIEISELSIRSFGFSIICIPMIRMWKFGHRIDTNSKN